VLTAWLLGVSLVSGAACARETVDYPCQGPSPVEVPKDHPEAFGVIARPLMFRAFGSLPDATIADWQPGTIQKVLILHIESSGDVHVRGARCTDGKALRFWYKSPAPFTSRDASSTPFPISVLESTGDEVLTLPPTEAGAGLLPTRMGYMFFTTPGLWRISVETRGTTNTVVFRVGLP
jgi:hypothetical protein